MCHESPQQHRHVLESPRQPHSISPTDAPCFSLRSPCLWLRLSLEEEQGQKRDKEGVRIPPECFCHTPVCPLLLPLHILRRPKFIQSFCDMRHCQQCLGAVCRGAGVSLLGRVLSLHLHWGLLICLSAPSNQAVRKDSTVDSILLLEWEEPPGEVL